MKTTKTKTTKLELQSRPEHPINGETNNTVQPPAAQPPKSDRILPYVNFEQREQNRSLSTGQVLDLLRQWLPEQFHLAEVVGKWIWITFPEPPAEKIRGQLGGRPQGPVRLPLEQPPQVRWPSARTTPCGQFATEGSGTDPRTKYGSLMASAARTELKAA